jgi:predicted N-acetyltransferase YhbS
MATQDSSFNIRLAQPKDIQACREVDVAAWGEESAATESMLFDRIKNEPHGNFVLEDHNTGKILGSVWTVSLAELPSKSWWESTGEGTYNGVCSQNSEIGFGVNLAVHPDYTHQKVGEALAYHGLEAAWKNGKKIFVLGARIPEYHKWHEVFGVEDYLHVHLDDQKKLLFFNQCTQQFHQGPHIEELQGTTRRIDPAKNWPVCKSKPYPTGLLDGELNFFMRLRTRDTPCKVFKAIPDYFPDPESCNFGALIGWELK